MDLAKTSAFSTIGALTSATEHLAFADPRLQSLITQHGPPERLLAKSSSCFVSLAKSILYQQLAGSAAAAIYSRFLAVCGVPDESHLTPAAVLAAPPPLLRGCGLSERKASYLQELAAHFNDGRLTDELLTGASDAELMSALTAVRGIGPWTVDMFSMFHLGRPDVLPVGDLAVRKGLAHLNGLSHQPSASEMEQLTQLWRPFRSLGCYYMWRIPLPAGKRVASTSAAAKRAGRAPSKKARSAQAWASPLGAAAAAVADVGVNVFAPAVAAGAAAAAVGVVASVASQQKQQQPKQQLDVGQPITPEKVMPDRPEPSSSFAAAAAAQQQQQEAQLLRWV
ncbi:DNA glycosylase [Scenedesmus sp. NREL 46B-D3]|nr:DNA glycosylase [Scenedesmus sp. NREL 46B-D3]